MRLVSILKQKIATCKIEKKILICKPAHFLKAGSWPIQLDQLLKNSSGSVLTAPT